VHHLAAAASFHGGGLYTDAPASPHTLLFRIKAHLYFGHGTEDRSMPHEAIAKLNRALAEWGGNHESEVSRRTTAGPFPTIPPTTSPKPSAPTKS
jgi:carboxymethylenebutenolidase